MATQKKIINGSGKPFKVICDMANLVCEECTEGYCFVRVDKKTFPAQISMKKGTESQEYIIVKKDDIRLEGTRFWEGIEDWVYGDKRGCDEYYMGKTDKKYKEKKKKKENPPENESPKK